MRFRTVSTSGASRVGYREAGIATIVTLPTVDDERDPALLYQAVTKHADHRPSECPTPCPIHIACDLTECPRCPFEIVQDQTLDFFSFFRKRIRCLFVVARSK